MKNLKSFEAFGNLFPKTTKLDLDESIIGKLIEDEEDSDVKEILSIVSKYINHDYITLYLTEPFMNDVSIQRLKSIGFSVKIYDDSNEYTEYPADKVKISWNYIGSNIINYEDE